MRHAIRNDEAIFLRSKNRRALRFFVRNVNAGRKILQAIFSWVNVFAASTGTQNLLAQRLQFLWRRLPKELALYAENRTNIELFEGFWRAGGKE